jgi:small conductance mechanosensitive channel
MSIICGRSLRQGLMAILFTAWAYGSIGIESSWARPAKAAAPAQAPAAAAPAPTPPTPAPEPPSAARLQLERLRGLKAELDASRQRHAEASGERREAVAAELLDVGSRYRRQLDDAALQIAGRGAPAGSPEEQEALRTFLREELSTQFEQVSRELDGYQKTLTARSEALGQAKPQDVAQLTGQRDRAYQATITLLSEANENLAARGQLGEDVTAHGAQLQKLLGESARWSSGALQSTSRDLARLEREAGDKPTPEQQGRIDSVLDYQALLAASQRKIIGLMDGLGLDTVQLRRELISTTREISQDILDAQVLSGLVREWKTSAGRWFSEHASSIVFRILSCLLVLAVFAGLARLGRGLVRRALARAKGNLSSLANAFLVATTGRVIWLIGFVIAAAQLGIEVAPLIAGLGIAGFVAGFALQDTLSNFASGLMILVYRPYDVGDVIEAAGATGAVQTMTLVYTSVLTPDNQMLIIPNNKIWGGVIRNVTNQANRRIDLEFRVSYADDVDRAESLLESILRANPRVLAEPAPTVRLNELADSCVKFAVRPWVKTGDYWDAYWEITRDVKRRFDEEGFTVPFPQQDLHIHGNGVGERTRRDSEVAPSMPASGMTASG